MKPDARQHKDADYFRTLVKKTKLSRVEVARRIGVNERTIRRYIQLGAPYCAQFAVECIVYASD